MFVYLKLIRIYQIICDTFIYRIKYRTLKKSKYQTLQKRLILRDIDGQY